MSIREKLQQAGIHIPANTPPATLAMIERAFVAGHTSGEGKGWSRGYAACIRALQQQTDARAPKLGEEAGKLNRVGESCITIW